MGNFKYIIVRFLDKARRIEWLNERYPHDIHTHSKNVFFFRNWSIGSRTYDIILCLWRWNMSYIKEGIIPQIVEQEVVFWPLPNILLIFYWCVWCISGTKSLHWKYSAVLGHKWALKLPPLSSLGQDRTCRDCVKACGQDFGESRYFCVYAT